jgi:hypothetical protein
MKKKILISLDEEVAELLNKAAAEQGVNKSQVITKLLKENVENRLSKYIVRDVENLILYLLLNSNLGEINKNELPQKLENIINNAKQIGSVKSLLLKEKREKRKEEFKNFWAEILNMLEPNNFRKNILTNNKYDDKKARAYLKKLFNVVKNNKQLWD